MVREEIDVLVTAMPFADLIGRLTGLITRRPVVSSFIDTFTYVDYPRGFFDSGAVLRRRDRLVAWAIRSSGRYLTDRWHATSPTAAEVNRLALRLGPKQVVAIEYGRGRPDPEPVTSASRQGLRAGLGLGPDAQAVLAVGRLHEVKGMDWLLDAWAILATDRARLRLLIAGRDDGMATELRRQAERLGIADSVSFLGHRDDVNTLLQMASVFVQSSRSEGGPAAAAEAFATGTPVVMPRFQLDSGMLQDGVEALFVDPSNATALAAAIVDCFDHPESAQARVERARAFFDAHLHICGAAARMAILYHEVAGNPRVFGKRRRG